VELVQHRAVRDPSDDGGRAEFVAWIEPHWDLMRRIAWRLARDGEGDDVLQNALMAAWRHRARYDESRGRVEAWLTVITVNEARKSRRTRRHTEPLVDVSAAVQAAPNLDLRNALRRLPKRQLLAVELHYYVGLPVRETALAMGCAEGTVKSTLSAARASLRALLGDEFA
jgi:RNA polymerase sigma-70 factor, ECF subfamily